MTTEFIINKYILGILLQKPGKPEDSTSAYFGLRFCTACCRQWGDMDVILDILALETGKSRAECFLEIKSLLCPCLNP